MLALLLAAGFVIQPVPPIQAPLSAPMGLVIAGAPGSGKGTQGAMLAQQLGLVHISVGELLRARAATDPVMAETMRRGALVPSALVVSTVRERLAQPDVVAQGFILDGFPRRVEEAEALAKMIDEGLPVDAVVSLEVVEAELRRRILARGRADDTEATFVERMRVYRSETLPALDVLTRLAPTVKPDVSTGDIKTNSRSVLKAVLRAVPKARARSRRHRRH